ncbi:sugar phosphorylase [Entomospira culicis]|uniref:Sugar phosphorylase n=1 Tax=Entomospira culicis TaxID=2719989 RepID=A0A968KUQ8_9SPIO|nr:sugar phosphorylase [Entomospira culicis]NIZ19166.1 sugar phosphorylase [Entomospira culicis]NIZ69380.1 sugar phosphorylase [Entomospira culicis]WDI36497.1 sugar phosphorylase [Entomospira culicis]WDI38123.1 sugar phosphorylase [Entomospira culicis]
MTKSTLIHALMEKLCFIYPQKTASNLQSMLEEHLAQWDNLTIHKSEAISEKNIYLIAYADSIYTKDESPFLTLNRFLEDQTANTISDIHLLPFFPFTSDDGFSVVDYLAINPAYGNWHDLQTLGKRYRLMFDFVVNHISQSSDWLKGYLAEEHPYRHYFIEKEAGFDYSCVVRPRTSPLFHAFNTNNGSKDLWTTFSQDQVDLNYHYPPLLMHMSDILLTYVERGASSIRLDAIGFLWRESGTSSLHLPQTHAIVQFWRLLLTHYAPNVQIITETNVPHQENISYFGENNEAHMVYQFALPPLVLHTFTTHNATKFNTWAKDIQAISSEATYFNFLSSHDGIGMRPVEGILSTQEIEKLVKKTLNNGGKVSYKTNSDGSQSVYELNINYHDALINDQDEDSLHVAKILNANALLLSIVGVPAIYYHSLLGSRNDYQGFLDTQINRRINRQKLEYNQLIASLQDDTRKKAIFEGILKLITIRKKHSAFSPYAQQEILQEENPAIIHLIRINTTSGERIHFLSNVSNISQFINEIPQGINLLDPKVKITNQLPAYAFLWIKE